MRRLRLMVRFAERMHLYRPHGAKPAGESGAQVAYPFNKDLEGPRSQVL